LRRYTIVLLIAGILFTVVSCNQISSGDKRLKLEFVYKMKSQLTQLMEVSFRIRKHEAVAGYEKNVMQIKNAVTKSEPLEGWKDGEEFKERFLFTINDDIRLTDSLAKSTPDTMSFESNPTIEIIKKRQDNLMGSLDSIISKVDRE
jgi:hypothetical protein